MLRLGRAEPEPGPGPGPEPEPGWLALIDADDSDLSLYLFYYAYKLLVVHDVLHVALGATHVVEQVCCPGWPHKQIVAGFG